MVQMQYCRIAVDERAFCFWSLGLDNENSTYLQALDGAYFLHIANVHAPLLDPAKPRSHHAAMAIRLAYGQARESLLALLCASVQSPDFVVGWMLKYRMEDLRSVVGKISQ